MTRSKRGKEGRRESRRSEGTGEEERGGGGTVLEKTEQWLKLKRNKGVVANVKNHLIIFHSKIRKFPGMREQDLSPMTARSAQTVQEERLG